MDGQDQREVLDAYSPRVLTSWLASDPDRRHRTVDGTLVFIDVSGYTRLTERLARVGGAAGAEAITETTDRIFGALTDAVLDADGDVLQFSGDALLVLFDGPEHAPRACRAAREMQRRMLEVGRVETVVGRARLRMSAGVHSGPIDLALLGDEQRTVVAIGEHATRCIRAEQAAGPGEVLVTAATARSVPEGWLRESRAEWSVLGRMPTPKETTERRASVAGDAATMGVPVLLRDPLAAGMPAEYRHLSIAFLTARHLAEAVARDGVAAVVDRLVDLARVAEGTSTRFGTTWIATDALADGVGFVLVAGVPSVREDDEDRALAAARAVMQAADVLALAGGVHYGRNFVGPVGHPRRRTLSITGDATNLTARIMGHAADGQLLASRAIARRIRGHLDAVEVEPFTVKGKRSPVRAVEVISHGAGGESAAVLDELPLVGRERELDEILAAHTASATGRGRIVELVGPAGLGKSRIVAAVRERVDRCTWGGGEAIEIDTPYHPFRAPLRAALGIPVDASATEAAAILTAWVETHVPDVARWLPLLGGPWGAEFATSPELAGLDAEIRRDRMHLAVVAMLERAFRVGDVMVLEDLHWFDAASVGLLEALVEPACRNGWVLLLTRRPVEGADPLADVRAVDGWDTIELEPLGPDDARRLALAVAGTNALSDEVLDRIGGRADGNPLYLRELVGAVTESGDADSLPDTVERVIASRLDHLPAPRRTRLREAAVLGRRVDLDVLAAITDAPEDATADRWWAEHEFVEVRGGTLVFRHDLLRDVAYSGLSLRRRTELHARAARALAATAGDSASVVAWHAAEGREWGLAWEWSRRAATVARTHAALTDALAAAQRAVVAARHLPDLGDADRSAAHEDVAEIAYPLARYDLAVAEFARAERLAADDPVTVARCRRRRGDVAVLEGRTSQGKAWYTRGERALGDRNDRAAAEERVRLHLGTAAALHVAGSDRRAIEVGAAALAEAEAIDDSDALAEALMLLATSAALLGEPRGGAFGARAVTVLRESHDDARLANTLLNLGVAEHNANRLSSALDLYAEAGEAFDRLGDVVGRALVTHNRGEVLADLGRTDEARDACTESLRQFRAANATVGTALSQSALGRLAVFGGDPDGGRTLLEEAFAIFDRLGHDWYAADTQCRLAECEVVFGDFEAAGTALAAAERLAAEVDPPGILPTWLDRLRGLLAWRRGDAAGASTNLERAQALAEAADQPVEAIRSLACRVELGLGPNTLRGEAEQRIGALGLGRVTAIPPPNWA